jgi:hypothetical protein
MKSHDKIILRVSIYVIIISNILIAITNNSGLNKFLLILLTIAGYILIIYLIQGTICTSVDYLNKMTPTKKTVGIGYKSNN